MEYKKNPEKKGLSETHTIAKYLFILRKTSCLLIERNSAISPRRSKACSIASTTYPAVPPWKSRMEAVASNGSPFSWGHFLRVVPPLGPPLPSLALFGHLVGLLLLRGLVPLNFHFLLSFWFSFPLCPDQFGLRWQDRLGSRRFCLWRFGRLGMSCLPKCTLARLGFY